MRPPRAVEYSTMSWDEMNQHFKDIFLTGKPYDTSQRGAERLSPVAAAHRILCNDFGMIPFSVFRKEGNAREPADVSDLDTVFKTRPNINMTPYMLGRTVMSNAFWHGFGAVWNRRDGTGRIVERIPLPSDCCGIRQDQETGLYYYDYTVDGVFRTFSSYELSFLFFESYDGIRGRGFLDLARETIGMDGAAQQYGRKFYQNGAVISGIVEVDADLNEAGRNKVRDQFSTYNPYGDDAFKVAVLTRGYKYNPIGLNQKDAQFIESRTFAVEEVSRFTGIPKHMLQSGKESYDSNSQQRVTFVQDTLVPYVTQWEQENTYKCLLGFQRQDGLYFKGNVAVLMRGDDKSRAEFYEKMVQHSVMNPDECRALEERNPIPGGLGKRFYMTKNLGSLESIAEGD
jgi:HK97 family phage portal protein